MGCTVTLTRPEHLILDLCLEIIRISSLSDDSDELITDSSVDSTNSTLSSYDSKIVKLLDKIKCLAVSSKVLPSFCLREVRHSIETLQFKKPQTWNRLKCNIEEVIIAVKKKTLFLSTKYKCNSSPNELILKIDFQSVNNSDMNKDHNILSESNINLNVSNGYSHSDSSKSKSRPSTPKSPLTVVTPNTPMAIACRKETSTPTSMKKKVESSKFIESKSYYEVSSQELSLVKPRKNTLDSCDINENSIDYGFYHDEGQYIGN